MKKVLITGITGFVGGHLARHLLSVNAYEVIGTYRSQSGLDDIASIREKIKLIQLDCTDADAVEAVILSERPDYICHLAAQASPVKSFSSPVSTLTNNIDSELAILDVVRKHHLQHIRILIISSGEIYGKVTPDDIPLNERAPLRPTSPYAVSKIAQDYLGLQYFLAYKLDIIRVRPFNHIGPGQKTGFVTADFAKQIAEIEKKKKEATLTVGNLEARRDFTDVRDMVRAYEFALQKGEAGDVYNIGSGKSQKIADMLTELLRNSKVKIAVDVDPTLLRPIDVPEIICDYHKFYKLTGWKPEISIEQTLQDILDYWRKIV